MKQYLSENYQRLLEELFGLLRIPSISADSSHRNDVSHCAEALEKLLDKAGMDNVEIITTAGHPVVYAEKIVDPHLPTVLVYGHYDVQPTDPLSLWTTLPFEPVIRDDQIFARGASDDKGQLFIHIKAIEYMLQKGSLPCNVKFIAEGEEEIGSIHLGNFLQDHKARLAADIVLVSDTGMLSLEDPSIMIGLRGLSYLEVEVTGPNRDLHSGLYGGAVANPAQVLSVMIASLIDENGRITIPGFYDDVEELSAALRKQLAQAPFDLELYKQKLDLSEVAGEKGYSVMERVGIRPSLDVNGIWSGYIGEGAKTVLPAKANAKVSMRLVPNQSAEKITQLFIDHISAITPKTVSVKITPHHGGDHWCIKTDVPAFTAASLAVKEIFGKEPVPVRGGGSIPVVALFEAELGLKTILLGFGLDSDAIHSANEHFGVSNLLKGIETVFLFYKYFAESQL
jgi:acetylornithine deacetylase/succinyl-diaminopimelate desuccinylase-like protein